MGYKPAKKAGFENGSWQNKETHLLGTILDVEVMGRPTVHPLCHRVNMTNGTEFGMIKDEAGIHLHQIWKLSAAFCCYGGVEGAGTKKGTGQNWTESEHKCGSVSVRVFNPFVFKIFIPVRLITPHRVTSISFTSDESLRISITSLLQLRSWNVRLSGEHEQAIESVEVR